MTTQECNMFDKLVGENSWGPSVRVSVQTRQAPCRSTSSGRGEFQIGKALFDEENAK